ncbi:hypothetical protein O7599_26800 [Streptomyces sp. WMMC500]|uniref:hypothetical protein n=1 Tax=Streptomyces sp. WMMC500 TaxID=3015154 RepID=UPI00248D1AFF|nr:hypothetical protein [Streptomyces sp. WMMC500]WBB59169.1 hypothetical protein O7599_26800 [Streptomyces sp. WMMC500]
MKPVAHIPWGPNVLIAATAALLGLVLLSFALRRLARYARLDTPAVRVAALAAASCTAYSADTSWRFAEDYLDMGSTGERAAMFAAAELGLFASALMARQNLNGPMKAPGVPGLLVWAITGVQIIPAYAESGPLGGTVRAFVGPFLAAVLWHLAMGIELRHRRPGAESHGLLAVAGREVRERLLSRLGITERDRNAAQISRDRATLRAVELAARLAALPPEQRAGRRGRGIARRLSAAVANASAGADREQRRKLLELLAARRHAADLATVPLASPWTEEVDDPVAWALAEEVRGQMRRATESIRQAGQPGVFTLGATLNGDDRSPEHAPEPQPPVKLDTAEAQQVIEDGWAEGLTVRETAKRATRSPSYVHGVFVRLGAERGPRPASGRP